MALFIHQKYDNWPLEHRKAEETRGSYH